MYINRLEGALDAVRREHPLGLNSIENEYHLREYLFHGLKRILGTLYVTFMMTREQHILKW